MSITSSPTTTSVSSSFSVSIFPDVLKEAFRRAQMSGRVYPNVSDYPCSVLLQDIHEVYEPYIKELVEEKERPIHCSAYYLGIGTQGTHTVTEGTYNGDDMAAVLHFAEL